MSSARLLAIPGYITTNVCMMVNIEFVKISRELVMV